MGLFSKKSEEDKGKKGKKGKADVNVRDYLSQGWLHCVIIIEIAGRPVEHVKESMQLVLKGLMKEKEVIVVNKKTHKPKEVKKLSIFSTFTEVELLVNGIHRLFELIFDFMPSSVEILEPLTLKLDMALANNILNDLSSRLHQYDALVKKYSFENEILNNKLKELTEKSKK